MSTHQEVLLLASQLATLRFAGQKINSLSPIHSHGGFRAAISLRECRFWLISTVAAPACSDYPEIGERQETVL